MDPTRNCVRTARSLTSSASTRDLPTPNVSDDVQVQVYPDSSVDPIVPEAQEANLVRPVVSRPFVSDYPGATIWWVEDDLELCRLVAPQLVACKWELHVFHHPSPMLASLLRSRPDLLILDQVLPKQTGQDVLGGLRQLGHSFPVLILSGMGSPSDRILGLEMGAQDYLVKPFHVKELFLRCEHLLGTSKVFAEGPFLHEQSIDLGEVCFSPPPIFPGDGRRCVGLPHPRRQQVAAGVVPRHWSGCLPRPTRPSHW